MVDSTNILLTNKQALDRVEKEGPVAITEILQNQLKVSVSQQPPPQEEEQEEVDPQFEEIKRRIEQAQQQATNQQQQNILMQMMSSALLQMRGKPKKPKPEINMQYLDTLNTLLYGTETYRNKVQQLAQSISSMGVCAKPLKAGDVAWKCEDCEKDSTCIICQDCFHKSDHTGHRVWLKTNVGGCCDCGDPDAWEEKGFCSDHKGFAASTDAMMNALPTQMKESAPYCFGFLANHMKQILLKIQVEENKKVLIAEMACLISFLDQKCKELPSNIYFVSKALPLIFVSQHKKPEKHECNYRYFINEEEKNKWEAVIEQFDDAVDNYCTCSTLDLIFQTAGSLSLDTQKELYNFIFSLFQTYEFKVALGMTYVANIDQLIKNMESGKSLLNLGVQLLTIDSITQLIVKDPYLRVKFAEANTKQWMKLAKKAQSGFTNQKTLSRTLYLSYDLKYMARPAFVSFMLKEATDFFTILLEGLQHFQFIDKSQCPNEMQPFDELTKRIQYLSQTLIDVLIKRMFKLMKHVNEQDSIDKLMQVFKQGFKRLNNERKEPAMQNHGFMINTYMQAFGYLATMLKMKASLQQKEFNTIELETTQDIIEILATQQGFLSEIKSKLWLYKGASFQDIPADYYQRQETNFWPDLGLLQVLFSSYPETIERFADNFGTNIPKASFVEFYQRFTHAIKNKIKNPIDHVINSYDLNFLDQEKLSSLVFQFLQKITQACIFENSLLFSYKGYQDASQDSLFDSVMKREIAHQLFLLSPAAPVDKIKKNLHKMFTSRESFMKVLLEVAQAQEDNKGKKTFKLKEEYCKLIDPFFYVTEKQIQAANNEYQHQEKNQNINNIIGDYNQSHKYLSGVNQEIWRNLAQNGYVRHLVTEIVESYLNQNNKEFINSILFNIALKLQIIICQNCSENDYLDYVRAKLPAQVLKSPEAKVQQILYFLSSLLHETGGDSPMIQQQEEESKSKQEQNQSKKKSILNKFKNKQSAFMAKKETTAPTADVEMQEEQHQTTCSACQETLTLQNFSERPFVQLGYVQKTKLLYHTYKQTLKQRQQAFENIARTHGAIIQNTHNDTDQFTLDELKRNEYKEVEQFGIGDTIDPETLSGVQLNRCCHYFHQDCLESYITSEKAKSMQDSYVQQMVGIDDNTIMCPFCKHVSNIYQPVLPLTQEVENVTPYVSFLSMLTQTPMKEYKELLPVDIQGDPNGFLANVGMFVTHQILVLTTYRSAELFKKFDGNQAMNSVTLRDLVFVIQTAKEIVRRNCDSMTMTEISMSLVQALSTINETNNIFEQNFPKLICQLLFSLALLSVDDQTQLVKATLESVYSVFKAQIAASIQFEQNYKPFQTKDIGSIWLENMRKQEINEQVIQMQLQFLRAAASMMIVLNALNKPLSNDQLGIDVQQLQTFKEQTDDQKEFKLLTTFLGLDYNLSTLYQMPVSMEELFAEVEEESGFQVVSEIQEIGEIILRLTKLQSSPTDQFEVLMHLKDGCQPWVPIPMLLTIPCQAVSFTPLPEDYQSLVKNYYSKKCRNCRQQVQTNAICLLCGEIVCSGTIQSKKPCCTGLPGQLKIQHGYQSKDEGELSYHARTCEAGSSVFIFPSNSEVVCIDNGRIALYDSFYRNEVGGQFSQSSSNKWENFYCNTETGGKKILQQLNKLLVSGELPNYIMQERNKKSKVIIRHIY